MGIFDRLARPTARADVSWHPLDARWYQDIVAAATLAGFPVDPERAKRVSAVFACNSLIAETVASLPCLLYRRLDDGGRAKAREHRVYRALRRRPNSWMSRMDFFGGGQMDLGLRGNALFEIRDDGRRVQLLPLQPALTQVDQLADGRLRYETSDPRASQRILLQEQVLHVRDLSVNGFVGQARALLAQEAIAVSAAAEGFVARFFKFDATGRLVITHPGTLTEGKRKELEGLIQRNYGGWRNRSRTMLLSQGVKAEEVGAHDNGRFIVDPRKFQVADVARFWRVPLFMIGLEEKSTSWGTGIEQQMQGFVNFTIKPWTDRWAEALELALLDETEQEEYFIEFLFADLVRGDLKSRYEAYKIGRDIGVWSPNEIRIKENEGPRDGGDTYQETPTGTAPNARAAAVAGSVPAPLLADAAARIAARENSELGRRAPKAVEDPVKWSAWLVRYYSEHREYVRKVLDPLGAAYALDRWVLDAATARIEHTAVSTLQEGVPEGWLAHRRSAILAILEETLIAGAAARHAA